MSDAETLPIRDAIAEAMRAKRHNDGTLRVVECADAAFDVMASELATLRTRLAEVEAENGRLRLQAAGTHLGYVNVYRDEDGEYELGATDLDEDLEPWIEASDYMDYVGRASVVLVRAALAQTTEKDHDDDT